MDKVISAVILAAGRGSRLGYPKIYAKLKERYFLEIMVENLRKAGFEDITAVAFAGFEIERFSSDCKWTINHNPDRGMISSVFEGINAADFKDAFLIVPVDHPLITPQTFRSLSEKFKEEYNEVVKCRFMGKPGHPVLLSGKVASLIPEDDYPGGLNRFIADNNFNIKYVDVEDEGVIKNVNTKTDLEELNSMGV